ncbi:MAG: acyltransferase domain-containing protein, partial [Cyanobacteria bacterium J06632_22]
PQLPTSPLHQTLNTQPALFAIAYGLVELWKSWGIQPDVVLGHSIGEYAAACTAGVMDWEAGLRLIAARGRLMQALPKGGAMAAVMMAPAESLEDYWVDGVVIAAYNSPVNTVLSGDEAQLDQILQTLSEQGIQAKKLRVSHAFHSPLMAPMLADFTAVAKTIAYRSPKLKIISTVTGTAIQEEMAQADYWVRHISQPVQFCQAMTALRSEVTADAVIEIGPKPTLLTLGQQCLPDYEAQWLPSLRRERDGTTNDRRTLLSSLGQLYALGTEITWPSQPGRRVTLPTYPFQRQRYWIDVDSVKARPRQHPLLGNRLRLSRSELIYFENKISPTSVPFLQEHQVFGTAVLPAVGYLEMALVAASEMGNVGLTDVTFHQALLLEQACTVQTVIVPDQNTFEVLSQDAHEQWILHASGRLTCGEELSAAVLDELVAVCQKEVIAADCYSRLQQQGVAYGIGFRAIQQVWTGENQVLSRLRLPEALVSTQSHYQHHPVLLDACLQSIAALFIDRPETQTYLPAAINQVSLSPLDQAELWSHVQISPGENYIIADIRLFSIEGRSLGQLQGLRLLPASAERILKTPNDDVTDWLYQVDWQPEPLSSLLSPKATAQQVSGAFSKLLSEPSTVAYHALLPQLETLSQQYMLRAVLQLDKNASVLGAQALAQTQTIVSAQERLFQRLLDIVFAELSEIKLDIKQLEQQIASQQVALASQYPSAHAELTLIHRCGENLAEVLRGDIDPLTLLFPSGDLSDLSQLYQSSPGSRVMNTLLLKAVRSAISPFSRPVRILEIGGGTGGTTAHLLAHLSNAYYTFTDISPLFISRAQQRFTDYSNVCYHTLDIEHSPVEQGFEAHSYDVVIASNVLHATTDLTQTLAHVQSLLSPGGQLVLLEGTQPLVWLDLIFGMTEGWWKRPTYPLLSVDQWTTELHAVGFEDVTALEPDNEAQLLAQSVILASAPPAASNASWKVLAQSSTALSQALTESIRAEFGLLESSLLETLEKVLPEAGSNQVVCLIDTPLDDTDLSLEVLTEQTLGRLVQLVQKLAAAQPAAQLVLVTQGAADGLGHPLQAAVWGLGRVIALEYPTLRCCRVDLDPGESVTQKVESLQQELRHLSAETIAYRQGERRVARLAQANLLSAPLKLTLSRKGTPDNLALVPQN